MNKLFSVAALVMAATLFISVINAQKPPTKEELLKQIATLTNTKKPDDAEKAYQLGKECLAKFPNDKDDNLKKVKDCFGKYRINKFYAAVDGNKFANAFTYGHEILADEPNNTEVIVNLAYSGYMASATPEGGKLMDETISMARKGLKLLNEGVLPKSFAPFTSKEETTAYMYFIDGSLMLAKEPKTAVGNIYKAIQINSPVKNTALPYYSIASYYEDIYMKMSADLKSKAAATKLSDAEFKAETDKINGVVDLMMDAYARTVTRAEKEKNPGLAQWKDRLVQIYKFRNKTETGIDGYIISANSSTMPDPGK